MSGEKISPACAGCTLELFAIDNEDEFPLAAKVNRKQLSD